MPKRVFKQKDVSATDRLRRRQARRPENARRDRDAPTHVIVIGTSSGGYKALTAVVRALSDDIPAAVIVIQHMAAMGPTKYGSVQFGDWLRSSTRLPIRLISPKTALASGTIYLMPPGMSVTLKRQVFQIVADEHGNAPLSTINTLFESAASEYGDRVIGVVLTGLLRDGTAGLKAVHDAGGLTIVQDPTDAEYPDMPASAMSNLPVTFCLKLAEIGPTLDLLVRRKAGLETGLAVSVRTLKERIALLVRLINQSSRNAQSFEYLSSELKTLELDLRAIQALLDRSLMR